MPADREILSALGAQSTLDRLLTEGRIGLSLLLHLSDLHLGNLGHEDDVGDYYKSEIIVETDRVTRRKLVESTLKALQKWLNQQDETLDAVIVTGDITTRARPEGFAELASVLGTLGDHLPRPERIVVIPGNHDVTWGTEPGSAKRYQHFVDGVRSLGYVTPLLDGVDYDVDKPTGGIDPVLVGNDFIVFAINSADMCGVIEPLGGDLDTKLKQLVTDGHLTTADELSIRQLRMYDMPRIQPRQMDALNDAIGVADSDGLYRVRIAAVHHQLAPVREEEEVKPFESIVNLASFTAFLADNNTDVVLHGHKHADHVQTVSLGNSAASRSAVVCSCGSIGGSIGTGSEVAKLIRIHSDLPKLRVVEVLSVPSIGSGQTSLRDKIKSVYRERTWLPPAATPVTVVGGASVTEVHEQLLSLAGDSGRPSRDLVCVVDDGSTAMQPPATYIWPDDATDPLASWFPETVEWWQDPARGDGRPFTHGQRLRAWVGAGGSQIDQIRSIADILSADAGSSRGIAVLVDPATDKLTDKTRSFPSFSLLHLWIEDDHLHCSAFFRKQEMKYWWAVNAAEIASIQDDLIHELHTAHEDLRPGSIRTHTSEAVFSDQLPKVTVPRIDRRFWKNGDSVRVIALAIADPAAPHSEADLADLLALLDDWEPQESEPPADGAPVPGPGLLAIANMLTELAPRYPGSQAKAASDLLRDIHEHNTTYLAARDDLDARQAYKTWRTRTRPKLAKLRDLLSPTPLASPPPDARTAKRAARKIR